MKTVRSPKLSLSAMRPGLALWLGLLFAACGNHQPGAAPGHGKKMALPGAGEKQCYNYIVNGDTVILTLKWLDSIRFTGVMVYHLKEKDGNIGTLEGQRKDSILLAQYQFRSEGKISSREVAFKEREDYLVEGFGDQRVDSTGTRFKRPVALTFDLNRKLQAVKCL